MASQDMQDDLKTTWDKALKAENCVQVRNLLKEDLQNHHELLKEGWKEVVNESLTFKPGCACKTLLKEKRGDVVKASLKFKSVRAWKGRTALHVAARRGDVELVKQILYILYPEVLKQILGTFFVPWPASQIEDQGVVASTDFHFLEVIDNDYELDALAMAVVNGNKHIANLLKKTSLGCASNPFDITNLANYEVVADEDWNSKPSLPKITKMALSMCSVRAKLEDLYDQDCDFNFLPRDVFFFHFSFSTWPLNGDTQARMKPIQETIVFLAGKLNLLNYLLEELKDGQGRTALHVAVDSQKVSAFLELIPQDKEVKSLQDYLDSEKVSAFLELIPEDNGEKSPDYLNVVDSVGRTPLYRAAAKELSFAVQDLLADPKTEVNKKITYSVDGPGGAGLDIDELSWKNGFRSDCVYVPEEKLRRKGFNNQNNAQAGPGPIIKSLEEISSTALHVAIIHKHEDVVKQILKRLTKSDNTDGRLPNCERRYTWPVLAAWQGDDITYSQYAVSTMQLTVLVGSIPILQQLLKAEEEKPGYFTGNMETRMPSFLLAAAMGNPGTIKAFLDGKEGKFNCSIIQDGFWNTALHHALKGKHVQFHPHLVDFVGCHHVYSWRWDDDVWISHWLANPHETTQVLRNVEKDDDEDLQDRYGQRRGSINLLLEAGIDIWVKNTHSRTANPEPDAPKDFVTWWYDKVAEETKQDQTKLNDAANAISVTAALVATASYVGPLTPPLGYNGDSVQVNILAVKIFVFCDSLSFYLALAAIMLALLPSLLVRQESMFRELIRTRILVAFAVTFLFPSIICVLLAFAAGYIAVIPDHGLSHHGLIVVTTVIGGFFCLFVTIGFFDRLRKVFKPKEFRNEIGKFFGEVIHLKYFKEILVNHCGNGQKHKNIFQSSIEKQIVDG